MVEKRTCPVCKTNADACGYSAFGNFKGYYHWGCLAVALSDLVTELESQLARQAPVIAAAKELIRVWGDGERYGGEMMELECAVLDLDEAKKGDRHEIE